MKSQHVLLIGLRGAGKSSVAKGVARRLGIESADLDPAVLRELGCPDVATAWSRHGEGAFRAAETRVLARLLEAPARVIALGGGTPMAPGASDLIRLAQRDGTAVVVYLSASAETLAGRLPPGDPNRPSLTGADPGAEMQSVLGVRDPLYRAIADHVVDVEAGLEAVIDRVAASLTAEPA